MISNTYGIVGVNTKSKLKIGNANILFYITGLLRLLHNFMLYTNFGRVYQTVETILIRVGKFIVILITWKFKKVKNVKFNRKPGYLQQASA
jgi:hypothetical protein